jgi:hypothetical protein
MMIRFKTIWTGTRASLSARGVRHAGRDNLLAEEAMLVPRSLGMLRRIIELPRKTGQEHGLGPQCAVAERLHP